VSSRPSNGVEWPTVVVGVALYAGFAALTWHYHALPWWVVAPLGGYLVAWHGSLQHEAVHGHPTRWAAVNEAFVLPSLWLWLPYRLYRETHLAHHRTEALTDPLADPESYYLTPEQWARRGRLSRALLVAQNTVLGRLAIGPPRVVAALFAGEARRLAGGDRSRLGAWGWHALGCSATLAWVIGVCGIGLLEYLALFVYPGIALTLLRSFLEHRADPDPAARTVIVEAGPVMSLLYLSNNLHALHHAEPRLTWYRLAARYRQERASLLTANRDYRYPGYGAIVRRYLLRPKEPVVHPLVAPAHP